MSLPFSGYELDLLRNIMFRTGSQVSVIPYMPKSTDQIPDLGKIQLVRNWLFRVLLISGVRRKLAFLQFQSLLSIMDQCSKLL